MRLINKYSISLFQSTLDKYDPFTGLVEYLLKDRQFYLITDHANLEYTIQIKPQIWWSVAEVKHISGVNNVVADFLSQSLHNRLLDAVENLQYELNKEEMIQSLLHHDTSIPDDVYIKIKRNVDRGIFISLLMMLITPRCS